MGAGQPTGEQFEITNGAARAVLTEVGACLRVFEVAGVPYVTSFAETEAPPLSAGLVLAPWPNRVRDGRWSFYGEPQQLELSESRRNVAIHGLTRTIPWQVVERSAEAITLGVLIEAQPGWPVPMRTTVRYALDADGGLTVTHTMLNAGDRKTPFGVGVHPYPRAGHATAYECTLQLAARTNLPVDPDRLLPNGPVAPLDGGEFDFREPRKLDGMVLDHTYGGCVPEADGIIRHHLVGPDTGVEIWAEPDFGWVQVFSTTGFPGTGSAIAVEPMTCPTDALNSGIDLRELEPGQTWSGSWGLRPIA